MRILHAADGSPHAESAERMLERIPFPTDSELIVANVVEPFYASSFGDHLERYVREAMHRDQLALANEIVKSSVDRLSEHFETVRQELLDGHAADEITKLAESEDVDLVTVGARGMNALERFLVAPPILQADIAISRNVFRRNSIGNLQNEVNLYLPPRNANAMPFSNRHPVCKVRSPLTDIDWTSTCYGF